MKKIFFLLFFIFLTTPLISSNNEKEILTLKYQAVSVGQISLACRLIALSTSLVIAKAVDSEYISGLLDNIDATIVNCKKILSAGNDSPDKFTLEIYRGIDYLLDCSKNVKKYSTLQSYDNLLSVRECIDKSEKIVEKLSEDYNKLSTGKNKFKSARPE